MKPQRRSKDFRAGFETGQRLALSFFQAQLAALRREVESEIGDMRSELNELREQRQREKPPLKVV